ncbi:serine dehydratase subunit alpha family protein [Desnuesiella massiliensis]|uniref:L-cysteine desulfidase family protein n=1 Tax=Desnuesiella massiliensis TaxID=1650662 RepID=UPI000AB3D9B1|nr:L-serine ammonia-lyase, iron-sulfur-dependent, subunit alpha [Desnuesiella massiliensis]
MDKQKILCLLKREIVPALGCTDPIAVAYAVSKASEVLEKKPEFIELYLSINIIKNSLGVGIPGTDMIGVEIAAALGAIAGDSNKGLEVLKGATAEQVTLAKEMVNNKNIKTCLKEIEDKLYIEAICRADNEYSKVIVRGGHSNIVHIEKNDNILYEAECCINSGNEEITLTIKDIYDFALSIDFKDIEFLLESAEMNKNVSQEGLKGDYGLKVGKMLKESGAFALMSNDLANEIVAATAAASDARMSGCPLPIMTTAGSGNQGITTTLPSVVLSESLGKSKEELARALVISNLVTIHLKSYLGRLSPLCGAGIAASTGSCCAMTYLLGGELKNIEYAIKNMIANVSGMICDGAKTTCALKIATAVNAAIQCSLLALKGMRPSNTDGIIHEDVEITIQNLGKLGMEGMNKTDESILQMMLTK